jgi:hypothetical protein
MTDPYLQALDDVAGELAKLQLAGPDFPAYHRGQILEQLGRLAGSIEELRRQHQAPAQDPGPVPRCGEALDGRAAWAALSPDVQAAIGAVAIEIVVCWVGQDAEPAYPATERGRAFEAAEIDLNDWLQDFVTQAVPAIDAELVPLPLLAMTR